jgi:hypothetical protein
LYFCIFFFCVFWMLGLWFLFLVGVTTSTSDETKKNIFVEEMEFVRTYSYFGDLGFEMASPRITLDQELYVSEDIFCSSSNFKRRNPTCIPCNYSGSSLGCYFTFFLSFFSYSFQKMDFAKTVHSMFSICLPILSSTLLSQIVNAIVDIVLAINFDQV